MANLILQWFDLVAISEIPFVDILSDHGTHKVPGVNECHYQPHLRSNQRFHHIRENEEETFAFSSVLFYIASIGQFPNAAND